MQNLLCVLTTRGQQTVVPEGPRVQLCAGAQHQTLPDLSLLARLMGEYTDFHTRWWAEGP